MGLGRFELPTPRLSSVCSDQLSYRPAQARRAPAGTRARTGSLKTGQDVCALRRCNRAIPRPDARGIPRRDRGHGATEHQIDLECLARGGQAAAGVRNDSRKEVIQPQVLLQLPCYDFTPITNHTFGACLPCGLARRLLVQPAFVM